MTHLLTTQQLAQRLNVSPQWVRDHASGRRQPRLPAIVISGDRRPTYRFDLSEVLEWLQQLPSQPRMA